MADLAPFSVSLAGTEHAVRDGLAQAMECLQPLCLTTDDAGTVELVLAEALNNVVEHALADKKTDTTIEIRGCHGAAGLHLTVIDHGAPMPAGAAPAARPPKLDVKTQDLPEGGFGWFMIRALATDVRYDRVGATNQLSLNLPVGL